jgi:biopolymer transport protein ExbD
MKFQRHFQFARGEFNWVPLTSIVLLIMVYFIIAAGFIVPVVPSEVWKASPAEKTTENAILVKVSADGTVFLGEKKSTLDDIEKYLKNATSAAGDVLVVISADPKTAHGRIVEIMDRAQRANVSRIAVASSQEEKQ